MRLGKLLHNERASGIGDMGFRLGGGAGSNGEGRILEDTVVAVTVRVWVHPDRQRAWFLRRHG